MRRWPRCSRPWPGWDSSRTARPKGGSMTQNTRINLNTTTGDLIAADEVTINGTVVKLQRTKIVLGADGVAGGDVSSSNPMPVTGTVVASSSGTYTTADNKTIGTTFTGSPTGGLHVAVRNDS